MLKLVELVEDISLYVLEALYELITEVLLVKKVGGAIIVVELVIDFTFQASYDYLDRVTSEAEWVWK